MSQPEQTSKSFREKWENNPQLAFAETLREGSDIFRWILGRNGFIAEPQTHERLRSFVVEEHVGGAQKPTQRLLPRRLLKIEDEASLVAVRMQEQRRHPCVARLTDPPRRVALRRLDLDHVGAEIAQDQRRDRPEQHRRHVDDAYAGERPAALRWHCFRDSGGTRRHGCPHSMFYMCENSFSCVNDAVKRRFAPR